MPILVKCGEPSCGKSLRVKDELAGKLVKCPACQTPVRVPATVPAGEALPPMPIEDNPTGAAPRKPARPSQSAPRTVRPEPAAPALLARPRVVLRPKRGLRNLFSTDLDIIDPETKEHLGVARDRTRKLFGLFKVNLFGWTNVERWEVSGQDDGKPLFGVSILKEHGFVSGQMKGIQCDILEGDDDAVVGCFRFDLQGSVKQSWQLKYLDSTDNELGRVGAGSGQVMKGEAPRIILSSTDGRELGSIAYKGLADAVAMMKEARAKGKKFGMVTSFGEPGLEITVAPDVAGQPDIHRALIVLAVLMEVTKIGKQQVGVRH